MSPEPSTNDYLADIFSVLEEIRDLLRQSEHHEFTPRSNTELMYAAFNADRNEQATDAVFTWAEAEHLSRLLNRGVTGYRYEVRPIPAGN